VKKRTLPKERKKNCNKRFDVSCSDIRRRRLDSVGEHLHVLVRRSHYDAAFGQDRIEPSLLAQFIAAVFVSAVVP
jgi:hypothetical protein